MGCPIVLYILLMHPFSLEIPKGRTVFHSTLYSQCPSSRVRMHLLRVCRIKSSCTVLMLIIFESLSGILWLLP